MICFRRLRNFDPANGFSWADGRADALQGNNNESTSEAANSYGAIILYGLITDNQDLVNKGIYLHSSTSAAMDVTVLNDGDVGDIWGGNNYLSFFDELNGYSDCTDETAGTESCASVDWEVVIDDDRGDVLEVTYLENAGHAGLVVGPSPAVNLSDYSAGSLSFDIKILDDGAANLSGRFLCKS